MKEENNSNNNNNLNHNYLNNHNHNLNYLFNQKLLSLNKEKELILPFRHLEYK